MQNLTCEDIRAVLVTPRLSRGFERWGFCNPKEKLTTNGFTIGKKYRVVKSEGNGVMVRNDDGYERFVLLDLAPSPHIKAIFDRKTERGTCSNYWPYHVENTAGYFDVEVEP